MLYFHRLDYEDCARQDYCYAMMYLQEGNLELARYWLINIRENRLKFHFYICI